MKLSELPDDFQPWQFRCLDKESLDSVPYEIKRWQCQCKGCTNGTTVRDYGLAPWYFLNRNSKRSQQSAEDYWNNLDRLVWFCGKHNKLIKRLRKSFSEEAIAKRLLDFDKPKIISLK